MLNSAAGVTLPSSKQAPPITTSSRTSPEISGALASAMAIFVSGPNAHKVIVRDSSVRSRSIKRVASGVGEGSVSVAFIHEYLALTGAHA